MKTLPLAATESRPARGWFKATRSEEALELIRANPLALVLAYVIATRARWRDGFNRYGLELGEAMLGDFESYGMTEQQYRTAKEQLAKWKFAAFRATNKGSIGKLTDTRLFSILATGSNEQNDKQVTDSQRTGNGRVTTNEEQKSLRRNKTGAAKESRPASSIAFPPCLETPQFKAAWLEWEQHRKELRKKLTPTSIRRQIEVLAEMGPQRAIAAIRHSISQGWTGIFEPGQSAKAKSQAIQPEHTKGF